MRHFIRESSAVTALALGVSHARFVRALVALLRFPTTHPASLSRAIARAVTLPTIAVRADETSDGAVAAEISPERLDPHQNSRRRVEVCASLSMLIRTFFHLSQRTGS